MDGNRRWARSRMLPEKAGHRQGVKNIQLILEELHKLSIKFVTFYVFSAENWSRSQDEVDSLFGLMREYIDSNLEKFQNDKRFRFMIIGDIEKLPQDLQNKLLKLCDQTGKNSDAICVTLAINYGSRQEIIRAVERAICSKKPCSIDDFSALLYTGNVPDPDLIIRTGGCKRLSNFLLWQAAYAELYFTDELWPDFNEKSLHIAINDYNHRIRNFGV